jgi:hypothetical protein
MPSSVTPEQVKTWLRIEDDVDDDLLVDVCAATSAWVAALPTVTELDDPSTWPADVMQGAVMLAARLYRRRNTPSGVEPFTDGAVYLPRRDGDVDAMLHIGYYAAPRVG